MDRLGSQATNLLYGSRLSGNKIISAYFDDLTNVTNIEVIGAAELLINVPQIVNERLSGFVQVLIWYNPQRDLCLYGSWDNGGVCRNQRWVR